MEENLVTVAIHTYEKAQILKSLLESEGIEVYIHNVNQIQAVVSAGVRVRIKESDLPKALGIIEQMESREKEGIKKKIGVGKERKILLPVDFSDYSMKTCDLAFHLAHTIDAEILLLHAYLDPSAYGNIPILDGLPYSSREAEAGIIELKRITADMENLSNRLNKSVLSGKLPRVKFTTEIQQGIPEEVILRICEEYNPTIIIMGTRGKDRKENDLIGSVTAEVIERSMVPVFSIPEDSLLEDFADIRNIAFATNFDQKDLIAFEKLMNLLKYFRFKVHFIHLEQNHDAWNEIKLAGIKEYFRKQYPELETDYLLIHDNEILTGLDAFVKEKNIDIISFTTHKRNFFARLFNPSFARKMIFHAKTPMLIFRA
ncbi:MAG: universal stress protein [Prevotellaceae bacterium]|jgi:nucleotide-binding universal stress UspA family protein|nr:universal stress protein [Prevotellaceae bacterium]